MSFINTYRKVFEVNIYHQYFLDDGITVFDDTTSLKEEQLLKYDISSFIKISPSEETKKLFAGHKAVFKQTESGFKIFIKAEETAPSSGIYKPKLSLEQNEAFTFIINITDSLFENYSVIAPVPVIPYFFSNKKPPTEGGGFQYIDLETTTSPISSFTVGQTTYNGISESFTEKEKMQLFGVISLEMEGDDTTLFDGNTRNILTPSGELLNSPKTFKIQIKNRSTIWNYRDAIDSSLIHTSDPTELPLVKNGIVGYSFDSIERPSAIPNRLIYEKDGSGTITKTISEIYIN